MEHKRNKSIQHTSTGFCFLLLKWFFFDFLLWQALLQTPVEESWGVEEHNSLSDLSEAAALDTELSSIGYEESILNSSPCQHPGGTCQTN